MYQLIQSRNWNYIFTKSLLQIINLYSFANSVGDQRAYPYLKHLQYPQVPRVFFILTMKFLVQVSPRGYWQCPNELFKFDGAILETIALKTNINDKICQVQTLQKTKRWFSSITFIAIYCLGKYTWKPTGMSRTVCCYVHTTTFMKLSRSIYIICLHCSLRVIIFLSTCYNWKFFSQTCTKIRLCYIHPVNTVMRYIQIKALKPNGPCI